MGSMEQIFTIFNDLKISGWGPAVGCHRITGLSSIPLERIQHFQNIIHSKYESFQTQVLTVDDVNEYDDIYIGVLPFQIVKYDGNIHELMRREMNHRFLLLNDFNITEYDIANYNYSINSISPLYRAFICDDYFVLNVNHAIADGISLAVIIQDLLRLLNADTEFNYTIVPYTTVEQCIEPKYASSAIGTRISNWIPTNWSISFGKFYANNSFLRNWNPLKFHRDDLLRFQYMFNKEEFLQFPLKHPYDRYDYNIDYVLCRLSKPVSLNIKKQCKLHKVHISSLFAYIVNAAMIESHSDILTNNYYKTVIGNVFTTIPMYRKPRKNVYVGMHACSYVSVLEYYRDIEINSDTFWDMISKISDQVLNDDMVTHVYKNKFPFMNMKKFMKYALDDKYNVIGDSVVGGPTVTNPGVLNINKSHYKYKMVEFFGGVNPGVGMGASYILGGATIKGVDEMVVNFCYGTQFLSKQKAQCVVNKMKQKFETVGSSRTNYQSKL